MILSTYGHMNFSQIIYVYHHFANFKANSVIDIDFLASSVSYHHITNYIALKGKGWQLQRKDFGNVHQNFIHSNLSDVQYLYVLFFKESF